MNLHDPKGVLNKCDRAVLRYERCGVTRGRAATLVEIEDEDEQIVTEVGTGRELRIGTLRYPSGDTTIEVMDRDNNAREGVDVTVTPPGEYGAFA